MPRLYSIASSPRLYPNEVHLTVALATHRNQDGTDGYGLCSRYLSRLDPGDRVQFYIHRNHCFRLPEDDARDIIMIGPGTGIAPFRAFVQERAERGATGRSWLFFGEQQQRRDFLYQVEWLEFLSGGALTRLDVAWSRDGERRVLVQDRIRQHAGELLDWLDGGAHLYLCGRKEPMGMEVEAALVALLDARHGDGREYLERLGEADRYVKDVY